MSECNPGEHLVRSTTSKVAILGSYLLVASVYSVGLAGANEAKDNSQLQPEDTISVYEPGRSVDTAIVVAYPENQKDVLDARNIEESLTIGNSLTEINKGLGAIEYSLGPDAPAFTTLGQEDVTYMYVQPKGADKIGEACYTVAQGTEIAKQASITNPADQFIVLPGPNQGFCASGEQSANGVAWAYPITSAYPEKVIAFLNTGTVTDETTAHEEGHRIGRGHYTRAEYSGDEREYEFLEKPQTIQAITENYKPILNAKGEIDYYRSGKSVMGTGPSLDYDPMAFTTYERAEINRLNNGTPDLYRTLHVDPVDPPKGLISLSPHNNTKEQEDAIQVVEIKLPDDHALRKFDSRMNKIAISANINNRGYIDGDKPKNWSSCQNDGMCFTDITGNSDGDLWEIPELWYGDFFSMNEDGDKRVSGSVKYIDDQLGFAILDVSTLSFTEDGFTQKNGIQFIKLDDLPKSTAIIEDMGNQLLAAG